MPGIICCICNHKGGVGKTSATVNLSAALTLQKQRVLVIDNDPQSNTTGILLPTGTHIRNSLYELIDPGADQKPPVDTCVYPGKHKGLYLLPNVEETSAHELTFAEKYPESLNYLREQLREYAIENFDFTFIDCPPTMGVFVANALFAADCAIVPIDAGSSYSIDGLRKVLAMIDTVKESGNPDLKFLRMLLNRVDKRTSISRVIISDVHERFGKDMVFKESIQINTPFQQAEYQKETIFSYRPTSRGAAAYRNLAKEFLTIFKPMR
jgi:chromosome partitioning protein